jgi:hypothetical protein
MDYDNRRSASDYDGSKTLTKQREPLEMKADADKGLFTGYASKFWVVDSYGEVTAPGAFLKSIAERGPAGADRIPVSSATTASLEPSYAVILRTVSLTDCRSVFATSHPGRRRSMTRWTSVARRNGSAVFSRKTFAY